MSIFSTAWLSSERMAGTLEEVGLSWKKPTQRRDTSPTLDCRAASSACIFWVGGNRGREVGGPQTVVIHEAMGTLNHF